MSLDQAFSEWCSTLNASGFAVESFLNPPANESELDGFESAVGFALPEDLRQLYRRANGQVAPFGVTDPSPGSVVTPLFGFYDFISLDRALSSYRMWSSIYDEYGDTFHETFNEGVIALRGSDPVFPEYWRPGWLPFSIDGGGNSFAVDLSPPSAGTYGQVIVIGSDEDERRVVAPSLTELFTLAARARPEFSEATGAWRCFDVERMMAR